MQKGRERKKFNSGKDAIESKKVRKEAQENEHVFADCRLARYARGAERR